jgi:Patatin-like phospholipase
VLNRDEDGAEHRVSFSAVLSCEMEHIQFRRRLANAAEPVKHKETKEQPTFLHGVWTELLRQARLKVLQTQEQVLDQCRTGRNPPGDGPAMPSTVSSKLNDVVGEFVKEAQEAVNRLVNEQGPAPQTGGGKQPPDATAVVHGPAENEHESLQQLWSILKGPLANALAEELQQESLAKDHHRSWAAVFNCAEGKILSETAELAARLGAGRMGLVGLAFSGGGIRSATFNLGILQGLAELKVLRTFDYLSTVSGGGFIGSWFAAWVKRAGGLETVQEQLNPSRVVQAKGRTQDPLLPVDAEPEPIYHLRSYSNYLRPRGGLFSADSSILVATYLRNTFLNQLVLLPMLLAMTLMPRFLVSYYFSFDIAWDMWVVTAMFASIVVVELAIGVSIQRINETRRRHAQAKMRIQTGIRRLHLFILVPMLVFSLLITWLVSWDLSYNYQGALRPSWEQKLEQLLPWNLAPLWSGETGSNPEAARHLAWIIVLVSYFGIITIAANLVLGLFYQWWRSFWAFSGTIAVACLAACIAIALYYTLFGIIFKDLYDKDCSLALMAVAGPPLVFLVFTVAAFLLVGLLGSILSDDVREWWASLCGWLMIYSLAWSVIVGFALLGPLVLLAIEELAPYWGKTILGSAWITTAVSALWAGRSPRTGNGKSNRAVEWLAAIGPPVFLAGLLVLLSLFAAWLGNTWPDSDIESYFTALIYNSPKFPLQYMILGCLALGLLMAFRVDVNLFSLQGTYANRIVRCYLGASRPKGAKLEIRDRIGGAPIPIRGPVRRPNPLTGFDPNDDLPLRHLRIGNVQAARTIGETANRPYSGPFLLINTAMNLAGGDELAWQERKAESFVLSPLYAGSKSTGYRRLPDGSSDPLLLGTAVAISGAAVSPNMGYHSSPFVTALLTVFNVRLGGWYGNPRHRALQSTGPRLGLLYLYNEMFGRTNARSGFVYLSDGGHFENLGVYELVRRRCRYIVACDSGADPNGTCDDLANVIRKCRTDFGVPIEINLGPLKKSRSEGFCETHFAVGTIHYGKVDPGAEQGILIYIKASLTRDDPAEVLQFKAQHPEFPHTPTSDQFFNESKFESYRALGNHIAKTVFHTAAQIHGCAQMTLEEHTTKLFETLTPS